MCCSLNQVSGKELNEVTRLITVITAAAAGFQTRVKTDSRHLQIWEWECDHQGLKQKEKTIPELNQLSTLKPDLNEMDFHSLLSTFFFWQDLLNVL